MPLMLPRDETLAKVVDFVKETTCVAFDVSAETRMFEDCGLDGSEALQFMEEYAETFSVKRGDFEFSRYFGSESFQPLQILASPFRTSIKRSPLTVAMLAICADKGVWDTASLNESGT
ncbi:DUF1493 family protein [Jiella mangrovi]|uniref:DUF1493 family protein n=1 Tax=Jiella mangrovi TaxID=2821407 RepID=A0ABS4BJY1_9HYPH|nr:DUF1493 family protein [Jiella mangrovi]MBP0617073.1 DUF1493 family protein [Jiella mangrovi]